MKCDRRWYNDDRLEREQQAWHDRDLVTGEERAMVLSWHHIDPRDEQWEVRKSWGRYHVQQTAESLMARGFKVSLPADD